MALTLQDRSYQPALLTYTRPPLLATKQPEVPTTKGRLTDAELDDIADEFEAFLEESGGILAY